MPSVLLHFGKTMTVCFASTLCCLGTWRSYVLLLTLLAFDLMPTAQMVVTQPVNNTNKISYEQWVRAAFKSQSFLTFNVPISEVGLCGSWHSGNAPIYHSLRYEALFYRTSTNVTHRYCSSQGFCLTAVGTYRLADQMGGIEWQLQMGIRRFHFELHQISSLSPVIRICKSQQSLCNNIKNWFNQLGVYDSSSDDDPCWGFVGVESTDKLTGCDHYSLSWTEGLSKIRNFIDENTNEIVYVQMDSSQLGKCQSNSAIDGPISDSFGNTVFTPNDLQSYRDLISNNQDQESNFLSVSRWPSANYLTTIGKRVIIASDCTFGNQWIHDTMPESTTAFLPYVGETVSANQFHALRCAHQQSDGSLAVISNHFGGIYEDLTALFVRATTDSGQSSSYEFQNGLASAGELTTRKANDALKCGFSPLLAHVNIRRVSACVWTWAEGHSSLCGDNLCTAIEVNSDPEAKRVVQWVNVDCSTRLSLACRATSNVDGWRVSRERYEFPTDEDLNEVEGCPDGSQFDTPLSPSETDRLATTMIGDGIDRLWLKYISPVTCHPTMKNPQDIYISSQGCSNLSSTVLSLVFMYVGIIINIIT